MAVENPSRHISVRMKDRRRQHRRLAGPNQIRKWRERAGLTLEEAAERIGQTAGNLSAIERGTQGYSWKTLEALAQLYGAKEPGYVLSVDPDTGIFPIWEEADDEARARIVAVARALTGKAPQ